MKWNVVKKCINFWLADTQAEVGFIQRIFIFITIIKNYFHFGIFVLLKWRQNSLNYELKFILIINLRIMMRFMFGTRIFDALCLLFSFLSFTAFPTPHKTFWREYYIFYVVKTNAMNEKVVCILFTFFRFSFYFTLFLYSLRFPSVIQLSGLSASESE